MSIALFPAALRPPSRATVFVCAALPTAIGGLALATTATQLDAHLSPWLLLWPIARACLVAAIASAAARPRDAIWLAAAALLAFDTLKGLTDGPMSVGLALGAATFTAAGGLFAVAPMLIVGGHARAGNAVGERATLLLITACYAAMVAAWSFAISDRGPGPQWLFSAIANLGPVASALVAVVALAVYARDKRAQARWFDQVYSGQEPTAVLRERAPSDPALPMHAQPPERNTMVLCAKVSDDRGSYREGTHEVPALFAPATLKDALAPAKATVEIPAKLLFSAIGALLMLGMFARYVALRGG